MLLCTRGRKMETEKISMREFRENLAGYLEAGKALAIRRSAGPRWKPFLNPTPVTYRSSFPSLRTLKPKST